jgi:hypothetical protein
MVIVDTLVIVDAPSSAAAAVGAIVTGFATSNFHTRGKDRQLQTSSPNNLSL